MKPRKLRQYVPLTREQFRDSSMSASTTRPVVAHGDSQGHEDLRRELAQWLTDIGMVQAGTAGAFDTLIGYYEPYATSHDKLDASPEIFTEIENAARSLASLVRGMRSGAYRAPDAGLRHPRQK